MFTMVLWFGQADDDGRHAIGMRPTGTQSRRRIAGEVSDLHEDWTEHADRVLADEQIIAAVCEALAQRHPGSRNHGRRGVPAGPVPRLLILKHIGNWSYDALEREARATMGR